ncbi:MAG: hypothetical protein KIT28_02395 [Rubrivivax sp.]|nr:hypothetical protein [Rubrivivax sp.]
MEDIARPGQLRFADEPARDDRPTQQAIARAAASLLDVARGADVEFDLTVDALLGTGQPLAKGQVTARAEAGTLRLGSSDVHTAGGTVNADVRVETTATPPVFAVNARARDLEYGPMLRALDPSTSLEGGFDFNVRVAAQAQPDKLLRALSGTVDVDTLFARPAAAGARPVERGHRQQPAAAARSGFALVDRLRGGRLRHRARRGAVQRLLRRRDARAHRRRRRDRPRDLLAQRPHRPALEGAAAVRGGADDAARRHRRSPPRQRCPAEHRHGAAAPGLAAARANLAHVSPVQTGPGSRPTSSSAACRRVERAWRAAERRAPRRLSARPAREAAGLECRHFRLSMVAQ